MSRHGEDDHGFRGSNLPRTEPLLNKTTAACHLQNQEQPAPNTLALPVKQLSQTQFSVPILEKNTTVSELDFKLSSDDLESIPHSLKRLSQTSSLNKESHWYQVNQNIDGVDKMRTINETLQDEILS